jgi:hypothetical protein
MCKTQHNIIKGWRGSKYDTQVNVDLYVYIWTHNETY